MKLLLDQGAPRRAASILRAAGLDTVHAADCGLSEASDAEIIRIARDDCRVIITLDADFHSILSRSQSNKPSVIRIRVEGLRAEQFSEVVRHVIEECEDDLAAGAMVSVTDFQLRVRRLPPA